MGNKKSRAQDPQYRKEYDLKTDYARQRRYNRERGKTISFRLFKPQDNDLINWLEQQPHKAEYFRKIITEDMRKESEQDKVK